MEKIPGTPQKNLEVKLRFLTMRKKIGGFHCKIYLRLLFTDNFLVKCFGL
jgi:hypothetical protein